MTLENANPVIVCLLLLPFVLCCLGIIALALNHYWKNKEEGPEILHARSAVGSLVEGPIDYDEEEDEEP